MTKTTLLTRLRELLAGEHGDAETAEAERLLAELEAERRAVVKRPAAAVVDDEAARWRRTLHRIGRGGGAMSTVVWSPAGREGERASVRENEEKTYARRQSPWR